METYNEYLSHVRGEFPQTEEEFECFKLLEAELRAYGVLYDDYEDRNKEFIHKKLSQKRKCGNTYISVPRAIFKDFSNYGINAFAVLLYFLNFRNSDFTIHASLKDICSWTKISRYKLQTVKACIRSNSDFIHTSINFESAKLSTPLTFKLLRYKCPYFPIKRTNLFVLSEPGGFKMFLLYCALRSSLDYKDHGIWIETEISQETLGKKIDMSPATVAKYLERLKRLRLIYLEKGYDVARKQYKCTVYKLFDKKYISSFRHNKDFKLCERPKYY